MQNRGISLIEIIVGLALSALALAALSQGAKYLSRSLQKSKQASDSREITNFIKKKLDCSATFAPVVIDNDCDGLKPIVLRDRHGNPITGTLKLSGILKGAGRAKVQDNWFIKATCSKTTKTVEVRTALANSAETQFRRQPLFLGLVDFDSAHNPIIGSSNPVCSRWFLPPPGPVQQKKNGLNYVSEDCEDLEHQDEGGFYTGAATCPAGQVMIGGGAACPYPGFIMNSYPDYATNTWHASCCGAESAGQPPTYGTIFAQCMR